MYVGVPKACMHGHKLNFMQSAQLPIFALFIIYKSNIINIWIPMQYASW